MDNNLDWQQLSEEKKRNLIKALGDGLLFLLCRKCRLDYFEVKRQIERLKNDSFTRY
jgi:hypothetical protein